jgi:hypothetical protein
LQIRPKVCCTYWDNGKSDKAKYCKSTTGCFEKNKDRQLREWITNGMSVDDEECKEPCPSDIPNL